MADDEYNKKLESLQQYIPFLNNMIMQLKDPRKKNREQQLAKMVSLHSMITDKKKKLKLETLIKCEDVILKLYDKVKSGSHAPQSTVKPLSQSLFSPSLTPSSPSPPRDIPKTKPVVIPTEKITDTPSERENILSQQPVNSYKAKIDIYSSAADSLKSTLPYNNKPTGFGRLGKRGPDMSKPPISMEDLEALQQDVLTERLSLNELTDLREKLQKQLKCSEEEQAPDAQINTTVRNTQILTKKAVEKINTDKSRSSEAKPMSKPTSTVSKPVKVIKEASSIFGSALTSIDNQILEGASKHKEKERRSSTSSKSESCDKNKERRSSKDEKKESSSGHKSSKDKTDSKTSEHRSGREKKDGDHKSKDRKEEERRSSKDRKDDSKKRETKDETEDTNISENKPKPDGAETIKPTENPPVYKRLADKYNPRPRKPSSDSLQLPEVPKKVSDSIESSMKNAPTVPFLDNSQKSALKTLPTPTQLPMNVPLLSPTSSTNSADNEIIAYNRKPMLNPQIPHANPTPTLGNATPIPPHVNNIMSNPNTSVLLNTVVNQFKGRQPPRLPPPQQPQQPFPHRAPAPIPNHNFQNYQTPGEMGNVRFNPPNKTPNNFWGNQHPPNYSQRSFTPIPNQFDNQIQQMDYYPPGNTPTPNPFKHQAPPILSPQENYDHRPPSRLSEDNFFNNRDVDMRYHDDWRRQPLPPPNQRSRDPYRDPRLHRDPRNFDPRATPRRDSREYERDRGNYRERDPRLNRSRFDRDRDRGRDQERNRDRERSWERSGSRPLTRDEEGKDTFVSPLDSLYSGSDNRKTGKGYGVQNFKIPKIRKEEDVETKKDEGVETEKGADHETSEEELKGEEDASETKKPEVDDGKSEVEVTDDAESKPKDDEFVAKAKAASGSENETPASTDFGESEENIASTSVSSSTECDNKNSSHNHVETSKEPSEVAEISSTNDIQENQKLSEAKVDDQTEIINKFLKKLLENERTRAAASLFIDNVSSSLDDEKLKMVVQTVKQASVDEEETGAKKVPAKKKKIVKRGGRGGVKLAAKKRVAPRRKLRLRKRRPVPKDEDDEDEEVEDEEKAVSDEEKEEKETRDAVKEEKVEKEEDKEVVVSVGERIKNRKRVASSAGPKKKKIRHKTELDLLHEDIQDMFIRDGVLTATGKRMCRLLKNENENKAPPAPQIETRTRRARNCAEKFDAKANSDKLLQNVRVLLPKIPVEKMTEEDSQRYSLRRGKTSRSYVESESDDETDKDLKVKEEDEDEKSPELEIKPEIKPEPEVKSENEPEPEEEDKVEAKPKPEVAKRVKKRSKNWASGILPKRKKKQNEEKEEPDKSMDFIEPDRNYYSSKPWNCKFYCKLCNFDQINITKHYKTAHPDSEVLSSRLSPKKAGEAIEISKRLGLDESPDHVLLSTKKSLFKCRFCDQEMNAQPSNFYDHVSTHTGEYRHKCEECGFETSSTKPLRTHYLKSHQRENFNKAAWIKTRIYGYICLECNFVQMTRKTVENHVNVYHLGEGKKIVKIHLSSIDDDLAKNEIVKPETGEVESIEKIEEEEEEAAKEEKEIDEPKPKRKKVAETARKKDGASSKTSVQKEKEIDMTVFTCKTNIMEEEEKIEQERLKKMAELNESVKTNRQSLSFVEQLSNRLMKEKTPEPEVEPEITIKTEPVDIEPDAEPENVEPIIESTPKKPNKTIEPVSTPSLDVVQKDNHVIQGMIQKLQGILKEEKNNAGPPPLAPLVEKPYEDKCVLSAGFLNISKCGDDYEYACRVPSCLFSTTNRARFLTHWNEDHTKINERFKVTKCRICQADISASPYRTLLNNFFAHVEYEHLEEINNIMSFGFLRVRKLVEGWEYACNIPSCNYITKFRDHFFVHCDEDHPDFNNAVQSPRPGLSVPRTSQCNICNKEIHSFGNFLKTFFVHVETEHLNACEDDAASEGDAPRSVLRTRRLSGDKLSSTKDESPELKESDENPFPFKIAGVMSLAEDPVPPLSPIREKRPKKIENVILKEAKLTNAERTAAWKSVDAAKKFVQCPRELYKCPQFLCTYVTSWRHVFENHVKTHAMDNDALVCCVYCDVKTPLSHAGLHIDLRHSNCLYSCSQCLYRALTLEYVIVHMKLKHKENDLIISLPPKSAKTIMMHKQKKYAVEDVCQAFVCGHDDCGARFLFFNEYCEHVQGSHENAFICGVDDCKFRCVLSENMMEHWKVHETYMFYCLICKFGCMELYSMLEHYSMTHPNFEPVVVDRRSPEDSTKVHGYGREAFRSIKQIKEELLESVNTHQCNLVTTLDKPDPKPTVTSEPPKNVTLVPLSLIQPGPSENKKIIAIIPNSVEGRPPKPVQIFTSVNATGTKPSFVFASTSSSDDSDNGKDRETSGPNRSDNNLTSDDRETVTNDNTDPLSLDVDVNTIVLASGGDDSDSQEVTDLVEMKNCELTGYQLYKCAFCDISLSNARDFKAHTLHSKQCRDDGNTVKPFKCAHCKRLFKNPHGLLEHIQYHGQLRFGCSLCVKKFPSTFSLKLHMRGKHNVTSTVMTPVVPNKSDLDRDEFIIRPVPVAPELSKIEISKDVSIAQTSGGQKTVYGPDEIDQLPKRYIFNSDVRCALCSYSTKVRTNLVRHLQFHSSEKSVPDIAPVNPVPCLDKNEKMFDKMTNLAISSFTGGGRMGGPKPEAKAVRKEENQVPAYVPSHRRYVCCADGCNYLCLEESNLRQHLFALHTQEPSFTCSHCKANLKTDIEAFLKHLKLHDLHLYKCSHCNFVHNLRHKVDKHAADKHPGKTTNTITIRSLEAEIIEIEQSASTGGGTGETPPSNIKWTKPWHCGMCKYRCAAKNDILAHIYNKHDINTQFKCTLCTYKTNEKGTFDEHFKENHPDSGVDIIHVYYKSEGSGQNSTTNQKQFDTTPLWQRDRPRIRHIRGILFEETSPQKTTKKSVSGRGVSLITSTPSTSSNLDLAIDAVAKGLDEISTLKNAEPREETKEGEKEETIIIIDDEEEEEEEEEEESSSSNEECELTIDFESETKESAAKVETDPSFLNEEILIKKYGNKCAPIGKNFRCPLCLKFRTKKLNHFVYHILTELKSNRFECKVCDFSCVTEDSILSHFQQKHGGVAPNYVDKQVEKTLEYWLQILIRYQTRALIRQVLPPKGDDTTSTGTKVRCQHCDRWFKSVCLLKDHELYHWSDQTYVCGHCSCEHKTMNEFFQHSFIAHPRYEPSLTINGPSVGSLLASLKCPPLLAPPAGGGVSDHSQFGCPYCGETEQSVEDLQRHVTEVHDGKDLAPKSVTKSKVEAMFACNYCHERGSDEFLKKHHEEKHPGAPKFSIYQFICIECSGTFLNVKDLRGHFSKSHSGKKLAYACVESTESGSTDQYVCIKCPFRSCTVGGMRAHLRKHLRPVDCGMCGATFIYSTEARSHHNKEHLHNTVAVSDNKERMREYEEALKTIIANKGKEAQGVGGSSNSSSSGPPKKKMLARKSTGAPFVKPGEYSYYGAKKEETDMKQVSTSIEVNKVMRRMTVEQFSNIFNIFPVVEIRDCVSEES